MTDLTLRPPLVLLRHRRLGHAAAGADPQGPGRARSPARTAAATRAARPRSSPGWKARASPCSRRTAAGSTSAEQTLVASAAVEDTVPEVVRAARARLPADEPRRTARRAVQRRAARHRGRRHQRQVDRHRHARLDHARRPGRDPTIMNGAVMKNFVAADAPFASARVGAGRRVRLRSRRKRRLDRALPARRSAVLGNVSLDHKSLEELRALFGDFLAAAGRARRSTSTTPRAPRSPRSASDAGHLRHRQPRRHASASSRARSPKRPTSLAATAHRPPRRHAATRCAARCPGRHNLANALAAIAGASAAGVPVAEAVARARHASPASRAASTSSAPARGHHRDRRLRPQPGQGRRHACAR